ncbi:hypothetical protein OROHE_002547 [Orobanche hederae]
MSKATIFFIAALLFFSLCSAARPDPTSRNKVSDAGNENEEAQVDESCHGVGEDECFMRRSLDAHIDYISEKKP